MIDALVATLEDAGRLSAPSLWLSLLAIGVLLLYIEQLLRDRGIDRFVLVTSPVHMGRALAAFRAVGLHPTPSASAIDDDADESRWSLVPGRKSLNLFDAATYEYAAWLTTGVAGGLGRRRPAPTRR